MPGSPVPAAAPAATPAVVVAATFTAGPIREPLEFWLEELGIGWCVELAPFGQVLEPLLDGAGAFAANAGGVNVLLVRPSDWRSQREPRAVMGQRLERFASALTDAAARDGATYVVVACPSPDGPDASVAALLHGVRRIAGVVVVDAAEAATAYDVHDMFEPYLDDEASIPYTDEAFAAIGTAVARVVRARAVPQRKVIALDADYTLWRGACGEDGPLGVVMSDPFLHLQRFMLRLREEGMLLCLCSRNDEPDVLETLARPDCILRAEHFAAMSIGWESKADHVAALAVELGLGVESFLLVDDDPAQLAEVGARLPEVVRVRVPRDEDEIASVLAHEWAFDRLRVTDEDRHRAEGYRSDADRRRVATGAPTPDELFRVLGTRVEGALATAGDVPRIAQLLDRTNQFRTSNRRPNEAELRGVLRAESSRCFAFTVADDFGDYGIVGTALTTLHGGTLVVENLAMSCRVLDRGVEHRMLGAIVAGARTARCETVEFRVSPTLKNAHARRFVEQVTGAQVSDTEDATYTVSTDDALAQVPTE